MFDYSPRYLERLAAEQLSARTGGLGFSALRIAHLPKLVLCIPLVIQWLWLAVLYRSLTLPSSANPAIPTGGLAGESKSACLAQIGDAFADSVADWWRIGPGDDVSACQRHIGLPYPLIAKPDIGWCGYGVQKIEDESSLASYAACFPRQGAFIIQRFVNAPNEAGLFYIRQPGARHGSLLSLTIRHAPQVTGDGTRTLRALIDADPDTSRHASVYAASLGAKALTRIPLPGEWVMLTTVASMRVGACYEDASACITDRLSAKIDAIATSMGDFHVGRFDVRFETLAALQSGKFTIIEVNGAGSEAIHCWDPSLPLADAFAGVFAKQRMLFQLGDLMRSRGHPPVGIVGLARAWLQQQSLIRKYPESN